ncbi:gamma-glutamyl-gamma-aminobutyrate hydrolase family protein, partial [Microcystis aeruginosa BLCCF108]|nr:gamma-glutamyl-gamma-aminobutyrate hydrolase family protein [Microcystis aeruginosa BLCC-F108]
MIGDYLVEYLVLLPWGNRGVGSGGMGKWGSGEVGKWGSGEVG